MPPFGSSNSAAVPNCSLSASISVSSFVRRPRVSSGTCASKCAGQIFAQHHLLERAGAGIGLERQHARQQLPLGDDVADAQRRRDRFGERADMDDAAVLAHGVERRRPPAVPDQIGVAIVLEDRHAVCSRRAAAARAGALRSGSCRSDFARSGWCRCISAGRAALEIVERGGERIHAHALAVERNADGVDAEPRPAASARPDRFPAR